MLTNDERDHICRMAAYYCMSLILLGEAEKDGKLTPQVEVEAKRVRDLLIAALHRGGYFDEYLSLIPEDARPASLSAH